MYIKLYNFVGELDKVTTGDDSNSINEKLINLLTNDWELQNGDKIVITEDEDECIQ